MKQDAAKSLFTRISNKIYVTVVQPLAEHEFISGGGQSLRYMFFRCRKSDILAIGFQACYDGGARYNYVRTIKECGVNRLFIKDDFGPNHCGDYYLGCDGTYSVENAVFELIDYYIALVKPKKIVFFGSSKGGYAAINFGLRYPNSRIVVAAPQYYLGTYLDNYKWKSNLEEILGEPVSADNKHRLDNRLREKIFSDEFSKTQTVYIHYSDQEHTYKDHIADLVSDLNKVGISINRNIGKYTVHGELKYYFPSYLSESINQIKQER